MIVSVEALKVEYPSGGETLTVLDIPSWRVETNEQVAISGPSGCGKSTLLNVLAGLLPPTRGSVLVCGKDIAKLSEAQRDAFRAEHIGFIFQSFNLLQGYTALENVLLGATFSPREFKRELAVELLNELGLSSRLKHYPGQMSLGEQQRVAIARALIKKPELILADEPTGSLDPRHALGVVGKLREACRVHGCTLIVVSHQAEVVHAFERSADFLKLNHAFETQEATA
jgi:putative ABC transport system ATP-binding protein